MPRRPPAEGPPLFDLPLDLPPAGAPPTVEPADAQPRLPLSAEADEPEEPRQEEPSAPRPAVDSAGGMLRGRLIAGLADLGVCVAVVVLLLVALFSMGLRPTAADWPAAVVFLLSFTFLYQVLPLAFWGRTPGMALGGLHTTSADGEPLSFGQTVRRWLAAVLTVALAGLPALVALSGRSLADRLSGSVTRARPERR